MSNKGRVFIALDPESEVWVEHDWNENTKKWEPLNNGEAILDPRKFPIPVIFNVKKNTCS